MSAEAVFVLRLFAISLLILGLEYLSRTRPQLMADIAFEVRFALMVPFVLVLCAIIWLSLAMDSEENEYYETGVGRLRA